MGSKRLYGGIAHNLAHHAQSGLSFVRPHVVDTCRRHGLPHAELDLLAPQAWAADFPADAPLRLAGRALQKRFLEMLNGAKLDAADLASARLFFHPVPEKDRYSTEVSCSLELVDGRVFARTLPVTW